MCGLCGEFNLDGNPPDISRTRRISRALIHRGPDDEGEFQSGPVSLGFRRLSILDLEGGRQPMLGEDGRFAIVFNGEIYNHLSLRVGLEKKGARFKTRSDTETLLYLLALDGPAALKSAVGMFALALWDRQKEQLLLARDPVGIKPLYYFFDGKKLVFSSEFRPLLHGGLPAKISPAALLEYLSLGKVHAPKTLFDPIFKLPPGHFLIANKNGLRSECFKDFEREKETSGDFQENVERLDKTLSESVKMSLLSDVPVGAFLSGGVDSALVCSYMAEHMGSRRLKTFSVAFKGGSSDLDESRFSRQAASFLGSEHQEIVLPAAILEKIEAGLEALDEPLADSAILPTLLLSREAAKSVKVVLTGEGADELFAGYSRYKAAWLNEKLQHFPAAAPWMAPLFRRLGRGAVFKNLPILKVSDWILSVSGARGKSALDFLSPDSRRSLDGGLCFERGGESLRGLNDALRVDFKTILPDSLLMKVDKSAMRASLEARVPFLNAPVMDLAFGLSSSFKMRRFKGKYILRRLAEKRLPKALAWRKKHGFIVPWENWARKADNPPLQRLFENPPELFKSALDWTAVQGLRQAVFNDVPGADTGLFFRLSILGLWAGKSLF